MQLGPGTYTLRPRSLVGAPKSQEVTVTDGSYAAVTLYVDIGIR